MSNFTIALSTSPAPSPFNPKSLISTSDTGVSVHLTGANDVRETQKAARLVSSLIHEHIAFVGQWSGLLQRVFVLALGRDDISVKWSTQDSTVNTQQLNQELMAIEFARNLVNQSPEDLSPESLAKQVAHHLEGLAPEHISAKHIVGDALVLSLIHI